MNNPRIYITIGTFHPVVGGAEKQALMQARSLRERGYAASIITFRHNKAWSAHETIEGVPIIRVAGMLLGRRGKLPRFLQKLVYPVALLVMGWALWQHRRRYDILHVYQLTLLALPSALVCRLTGTPMVIAARSADSGMTAKSRNKASLIAGPLDATPPWLQVDADAKNNGDLKDLERLGKPLVQLTRSLLQSINARVIVLSSRMQSYLTAHDFHLPGTQCIPNGVDISRFTPLSAPLEERAQVVICVARLCYQKGVDVLLQAWHLVHKQAPQARLIIVGGGPIQTELERLAQSLDILGSVEFAGTQSDMQAQLRRGGLAVLPSRWEGMPNAVLEAMACGMPCVATRVSGSEDIILHGVNGLLVEPEDYQGMAQALLALLGDPGLVQKYGRAARTTIERHYSLEHITDVYIELYRSIANRRWRGTGDVPLPEISHLPLQMP